MQKAKLFWVIGFALLLAYGSWEAYSQFKIYHQTHQETKLSPGSFRRF